MADDICKICKRPKSDHNNLFHAFSVTGTLEKTLGADDRKQRVPASLKRPQAALKGDPVLRMAMVRKGLVTADELEEIENELRSTGAVFDVHSPGSTGRDPETGDSVDAEGGMRSVSDPGAPALPEAAG